MLKKIFLLNWVERYLPFGLILILVMACTGCNYTRLSPEYEKKKLIPLLVQSAEKSSRESVIKRLDQSQYPYFSDSLAYKNFKESLSESLLYFSRLPDTENFSFGQDVYTVAHLINSLKNFSNFLSQNPDPQRLNKFIRQNYLVYEIQGSYHEQVLFTGYYEPVFFGSIEQNPAFPYPLFSVPKDFLKIELSRFSDKYNQNQTLIGRLDGNQVVPYYSREEIDSLSNFAQRARPVAWLADRIDRFFLEIQGSGRIQIIEDGKAKDHYIRVHYAGSNGHAYKSVGKYLIDKGEIAKKDISMTVIRKWLEAHSDRIDEVLYQNKSMIFFQIEKGGPYGSLGVKLTPLRSIATDTSLIPKGVLCFAKLPLPDRNNFKPRDKWEYSSMFVMNQDTGGAIKGPGRADLFCGTGKYAEFAAGNMNNPGKLYLLILKRS